MDEWPDLPKLAMDRFAAADGGKTMRRIDMTEEAWRRLLELKEGRPAPELAGSAEEALYGPIASAHGGFVLAQVGQSLDGRVATLSGDARDISGPDGLAHLHRCRALVDAVIVGVGTVTADNPRLSVREVTGPSPVRVVIDCHAELTGAERLLNDDGAPVVVVQGADAPRTHHRKAEIIRLAQGEAGLAPAEVLGALRSRGLNRVLVEGGARTIARFVSARLVDRLHVAVAPLIIGSGPSGILLPPVERLSAAHRPETTVYSLGSDILFDCVMRPAGAAAAVPPQGEDPGEQACRG